MAKTAGNDYFQMFVTMTEISCKITEKLQDILKNFEVDSLFAQMEQLHSFENEGDREMHSLLEKLAKEFITPIERDDILTLAREIDDVTDSVEDVLQRIYMYNISEISEEAHAFVDIILRCCRELQNIMLEFRNFKKSKTLHASIVEVNRLEEEGDKLFIEAVRKLYTEKNDIYATIAWTEVYACLEKCCDKCEHVANIVEGVVMNNT